MVKSISNGGAEKSPSPLASLLFLGLLAAAFWAFFLVVSWAFHHAPEPIGSRADLLSDGARITLLLTGGAGLVGILVGVCAGLAKLNTHPLVRWPADFFVWMVRGTPLLVQILFIYYALPAVIPALQLSEFSAALIALALNVGAYNAEVIRAGIIAIPKGQTEAARSLGLSKFKTMRFVILPQAIRLVVPPLINNIVALLKDSSLASSIDLLELTLAGNRISSETFQPVPVLTSVAAIYLIMTTAITFLASFLERKLRLPNR